MKDYRNYHGFSFNDKLKHDGDFLLQQALNGIEGYDVKIDGKSTRLVIQNKFTSKNGTEKNVIGINSDVKFGNLIRWDSEDWLITSRPEDNFCYSKAVISYCNADFPFQSESAQGEFLGYDDMNRPVYDEVSSSPLSIPCVVQKRISTSDIGDEEINLPEGKIQILLPYSKVSTLDINYEFEMYGERYQINDLDKTQVSFKDNSGILIVTAERV